MNKRAHRTIGPLKLDSLSSPGFAMALLNAVSLVLNFIIFSRLCSPKKPNESDAQVGILSETESEADNDLKMMEIVPEENSKKSVEEAKWYQINRWTREIKLTVVGAMVYIVLNFVSRGVLSLVETIGTPLFQSIFKGSTTTDASHFYLALGVLGMVVYLVLGWARKVASEITILIFGFLLIATGLVVVSVADWSNSKLQFAGGCALLLSFGSPIVQTVILSSFSSVLGSKPQGTLMGIITMSGSVGRIVFPFTMNILGNIGSFALGAVLSLISIVGVLCYSSWVTWLKRRNQF